MGTRTSGSEVRVGETDRPKGRHRAPARPSPPEASDVIWRFAPARPPLDRGPVTGDDGLAEAAFDVVLDGETLLQLAAHTGGAELWSTQHQCSVLGAVRVESDDRLDVLRAPRPCPHVCPTTGRHGRVHGSDGTCRRGERRRVTVARARWPIPNLRRADCRREFSESSGDAQRCGTPPIVDRCDGRRTTPNLRSPWLLRRRFGTNV